MSKIQGRDVAVYIGGKIQAFATQAEIDMQWEMKEVANGAVRKYIPWKFSWAITSAHFTSDKKWNVAPANLINGTQVAVKFQTVTTDGVLTPHGTSAYRGVGIMTFSGNGYIKRMTVSAQNKTYSQMSMEIQGSGSLTVSGDIVNGSGDPD